MRIFIVCQFFPPVNVIGAVRAYQLGTFLVNKGYDVTVFTSPDDNMASKNYEVDISSIKVIQIPAHRYVECLDGQHPRAGEFKIFKQILRNIIYPDHFVFKKLQYISAIENEINLRGSPDVIITMPLPFSLNLVGKYIKIKYKEVKWIADFRDLWAVSPYRKMPMFTRFIDTFFEKRILSDVNHIIVVTNHMKREMEKYLNNPIDVIFNGYSLDDVSHSLNKTTHLGFVYTGLLYNGMRDFYPLLEALDSLGSREPVIFYGSEKELIASYKQKFRALNIQLNKKVSKKEINNIQENAKYLIIALGKDVFEKGVLTGKFFDYVKTNRPIIAICDEDSELAGLINQYNLGIATRDPEKIKKFIESNSLKTRLIPNDLAIETQFLKLESIFKISNI